MTRLSQMSTSFVHFWNDSRSTNYWFYVLCIFWSLLQKQASLDGHDTWGGG